MEEQIQLTDEEIKKKIVELARDHFNRREALSTKMLAKTLGITQYKLVRYLTELELENKIKVLRHKKILIVIPTQNR